jgi:16S rRNA (guanine(966)-N(2))-methyltransferase RsmD
MRNNQSTIIATGKFKNRKITIPSINTTRSSKSILSSSFFDTIRTDITDTNFIEAFAGSGLIGITALSEGAKKAYFIEKNRAVFGILSSNLSFVSKDEYQLINNDSFLVLGALIDNLKSNTIIYYDPPFSIRENNSEIYKRCFENITSITNKNVFLITIEHMSGLELPESLGIFNLTKTKKFGKSSLSYYEQ